MHVPCSLGYFECQHVAPNCCCHIRKASITTCLLVAHWQSKLQVTFCTRSTTVSKTQSVYKQIYGLGESFAPDPVTSYKLWLLPQIGQSRLLHLLSITRQWLCLIDCVPGTLYHTKSDFIITFNKKASTQFVQFLMYWILWSCNVVFCYYGLKVKFIIDLLVNLGHTMLIGLESWTPPLFK